MKVDSNIVQKGRPIKVFWGIILGTRYVGMSDTARQTGARKESFLL